MNSIVGGVARLQGGHTHSVVLNSDTYNTPLKQQHTIVKNKQDAFTPRGLEGRKTVSTGVPVTGAVLGSLASLGVGGALVFSGIKYLNWFNLGEKTKSIIAETIPTAVNTALKLPETATEKTVIDAIQGLHATIEELQAALAKEMVALREEKAKYQNSQKSVQEYEQKMDVLNAQLQVKVDELKQMTENFMGSFSIQCEQIATIDALNIKLTQFQQANRNVVNRLTALQQEMGLLRIKSGEEQATRLKLDTQLFSTLNGLPDVGEEYAKLQKYVQSVLSNQSSGITGIEHPQNLFNLQLEVYQQLQALEPQYQALQAKLAGMKPESNNLLEQVVGFVANPILNIVENKSGVEAELQAIRHKTQQLQAISAYLYQEIVEKKENTYGLITEAEKTILQATVAYNHSRVTAYCNYLNGGVENNNSQVIFDKTKTLMNKIPENRLPSMLREVLENGSINQASSTTKLRVYEPDPLAEDFFDLSPRVLDDIAGVFPSFVAQSQMKNVMQVLTEQAERQRTFGAKERETVQYQIDTLLAFYGDDERSGKDQQIAMLHYATLFAARPLLTIPLNRNDNFRNACIAILTKIQDEKRNKTCFYDAKWFEALRQRFQLVDDLFSKQNATTRTQLSTSTEYEAFMFQSGDWLHQYNRL